MTVDFTLWVEAASHMLWEQGVFWAMLATSILLLCISRFTFFLHIPFFIKILFCDIFSFFLKRKTDQKTTDTALVSTAFVSDGFSLFQSLSVFLSAVATPIHLAGVAGIMIVAGPGALFYLWLFIPFAMVLVFVESLHAADFYQRHHQQKQTETESTALPYPRSMRFLSIFYAVLLMITALGIGNIFQTKTIAILIGEKSSLSVFQITLFFTLLTILCLGLKRKIIVTLSGFVLSVVFIFYSVCVFYLLVKKGLIYGSLQQVFLQALSLKGLSGGVALIALKLGLERNLFSFGGFGLAAIAHAQSTHSPYRRAGIASLAVPIDVMLLITPTALVVIASGLLTSVDYGGFALLQHSFAILLPKGDFFILGFATILTLLSLLGWNFYGEYAFSYLFDLRYLWLFRSLWITATAMAPFLASRFFLSFADSANALLAIPVLIILWLLMKRFYQFMKKTPLVI